MSCESRKSCCTGECAGHCRNSGVSMKEVGLNAIVELEIHYSESEDAVYIFEALYAITNIQAKELKLTGLEGNKYASLDSMKLQVIDSLTQADNPTCQSYEDVDLLYIRDDV